MMPDFFDLSYLANGSPVQRQGLEVIHQVHVTEILSDYQPVLAGTLPLDLFIEGSDLDILCYSKDLNELDLLWSKEFGEYDDFEIHFHQSSSIPSLVAGFMFREFKFELFAQSVPTGEQVAYRHMVNEYLILENLGDHFKKEIIRLKRQGIKTEEAFARLLNLPGDPFEAMLHYKP